MSVRRASWEGGFLELRMLQAAMSEAHLILHGPPDLPHNAEILGVCGVSTENADQNKYGWMVADFLHWKLLFHGVSDMTAQTWISSLDIAEFLKGVDGVDMINDGTIYNFVGKHEDAIVTVPSDGEGFTTAFLRRLAESARLAVSRRTVLAVLVFAPVTPEQDICVDLGGEKIYLTAERLRDTINNAVGGVQLRVVLVTPSPFTGGWLCRPSLMNRPACPAPDNMLRIIAKSCGGAFADRSILSFSERNTPLMTDAQRDKVKYDDPMPLRPTKLQTDYLHYFQRQIHESLEHRLSASARDHAFILEKDAARDPASFSDTWLEYGPRQSRPLEFWAKHWGSPRPKIDHTTHRFEFLGEAFGGTRESQFFHLKYLIAIELDTHPGDWERQVGGVTRELYTSFQQRLMPSVDDAKRVFDTIEFRASSAILAQMVAKAFDLPMPDGVKCRYWHDKMDGVDDAYYRKLQFAFGEALRLFDQAAVLPSERWHEFKNVRFLRAARWLSAATALKFENGSREDIEDFVRKDVARLIAKIRDAQKALLLEDRSVARAGLNWIAALGLGVEVQPIPGAASPEREDIGFTEQNNQRRIFTPALDAQAAPWPSKPTASKPIACKPIERKWPTKRVMTAFAEAESSLTQSDVQDAVKNTLEDFGTRPAANTEDRGIQGLTETWNPTFGVKFEVKGNNILPSGKFDPLGPKAPGTNFQASHTHGEFGSNLVSSSSGTQEDTAKNDAVTGEKATSIPIPSSCVTNGTAVSETVADTPIAASIDIDNNASAWDKIFNTPATSNGGQDEKQVRETVTSTIIVPSPTVDDNASAWEKAVDTPVTSNGGQGKKKVRIVLPEPAEDLPDVEHNKMDEPVAPDQAPSLTIDDNASAWDKILGPSVTTNSGQDKKPVQIAFREPSVDLGLEEKKVDEPAVSPHTPSVTIDDNAGAWEEIPNTGREDKEQVRTASLEPSSDFYLNEKKADESAASPQPPSLNIDDNANAWDKILGTSATSNGGQEAQVGVTLCDPSDDVHNLEDKKSDEPTVSPHMPSVTIDDNASAWDKILDNMATSNGGRVKEQVGATLGDPSAEVNDLEDKTVDERAPAPQAEPAAGTPVEQAMKRLTESLMAAGMMSGSMSGDDNAVTRLLQKAAEMVEQEKTAKASGFKGETSPVQSPASPVQASYAVNGTSGVSVKNSGTDLGQLPATSWDSGSVQDTANDNEAARVPAEKPTITLAEVSSEITMGHSAVGQVTDMEGSGDSSENGKTTPVAAVEVTASGDQAAAVADADPEVNLVSGDDFWAKAAGKGIKF